MREDLRAKFETKSWAKGRDDVPRSGPGSDLAATAQLRAALPGVFDRYKVQSFLDAPCGDWFWMSHVDLGSITYIGGDISGELVDDVAARHSSDTVSFRHLDITSDPLPQVDMMMVRDGLFHLQHALKWAFYRNFLDAGTPHLLSTINHVKQNGDLKESGRWKPFNPMLAPFNLPTPLEMIHETDPDLPDDWQAILERDDHKTHRSLGIWTRDQIATAVTAAGVENSAEMATGGTTQ